VGVLGIPEARRRHERGRGCYLFLRKCGSKSNGKSSLSLYTRVGGGYFPHRSQYYGGYLVQPKVDRRRVASGVLVKKPLGLGLPLLGDSPHVDVELLRP